MPRLACILPVLGSPADMEPTLVSLLEHRPADCEILLVFNQPYSDPYNLAGEVRMLTAPPRADLIDCVNLALQLVESPYIHLLSVGVTVTPGWTEPALACFQDPHVALVAPAIMNADRPDELLAAGWRYAPANGATVETGGDLGSERETLSLSERRSSMVVGPLWQAAFYRTMALELLGARIPRESGTAWWDVDLALMLRHAGYRAESALSSRVLVAPAAIERTVPTGYFSGRCAEQLYRRNTAQADWVERYCLHPARCVAEALRSFWRPSAWLELAGRAAVLGQTGKVRRHREHLEDVRLACEALLRINRAAHIRLDTPSSVSAPKSAASTQTAPHRAA